MNHSDRRYYRFLMFPAISTEIYDTYISRIRLGGVSLARRSPVSGRGVVDPRQSARECFQKFPRETPRKNYGEKRRAPSDLTIAVVNTNDTNYRCTPDSREGGRPNRLKNHPSEGLDGYACVNIDIVRKNK